MRIFLSALICVVLCASLSYCNPIEINEPEYSSGDNTNTTDAATDAPAKRLLNCIGITPDEFYGSVANPRKFDYSGIVAGGVLPHHATAAALIAGFFEIVSGESYDTVVIVAPNHSGEGGEVILSFCDWVVGDIVRCDTGIVGGVYDKRSDAYTISENDDIMEGDHSASVLIPYINRYFPDAEVAAFLLTRRLSLENTYNFAKILTDEILSSGKKVLFICSADFSHYLPPALAAERDAVTWEAVLARDYYKISKFSNEYVDSPQSLLTFLMYLDNIGADNLELLYNSDASEFLGGWIEETTSYFVMAGG